MKLLFDANLSPGLARSLTDLFADCEHVFHYGDLQHDDHAIWEHATKSNAVIVSKDTDFSHMSMLWGPPPKVIWLAVGNASTGQIEKLLRSNVAMIGAFMEKEDVGLLILRL